MIKYARTKTKRKGRKKERKNFVFLFVVFK